MTTKSRTTIAPSASSVEPNGSLPTHHVRTFFASLLGIAAVGLIFLSILTVWLDRTLTNTATFTATVAPLGSKPEIQNFVAEKVDDQLMKNVSVQDIATTLLPVAQTTGVTDQQLMLLVQPLIRQGVASIVGSPAFAAQWQGITRSAHQQFITQLQGSSDHLTLNLSPAVNDVVADLKQTSLAPISNHIQIDQSAGKLNIQGNGVTKVRRVYKTFREGTMLIVVLALVLLGGCVALSVHHGKTMRRVSMVVGIGSLLFALLLEAPRFLKIGGNPTDSAAAMAFMEVLLHNLQVACVVVGMLGVAGAIGSKLYSARKRRTT